MVSVKMEVAKTATEGLRVLWRTEFFAEWRQKASIVDALAKLGNHFSDAEIGMALIRAPHLTRRGKRGRYEYIQKYPFIEENSQNGKKAK